MTTLEEVIELLNSAVREFEKLQTHPRQPLLVSRRIGAIVKHMKDLREDLRPGGLDLLVARARKGEGDEKR